MALELGAEAQRTQDKATRLSHSKGEIRGAMSVEAWGKRVARRSHMERASNAAS